MPQDIISFDDVHSKIHTIRGVPVMLDSDLAHLYGIETKYINRAMKRNIERFPSYFCFQITAEEYKASRCQDGTLNLSEVVPHVFTEQGIFEGILHRYVQESVYSEDQGAEIAFQCLGNL